VTEDTAQRDVRHTEAAVHRCAFFDRMFDTAIACGLKFMLTAEEQRRLIHKVADVLVPGSRVLFTSCAGAEAWGWNDALAGLQSRSLGAAQYRRQFAAVGLPVIRKYEGIGERPTRRRKGARSINDPKTFLLSANQSATTARFAALRFSKGGVQSGGRPEYAFSETNKPAIRCAARSWDQFERRGALECNWLAARLRIAAMKSQRM